MSPENWTTLQLKCTGLTPGAHP
ncbi:hypothetical protein CCP3SC5AM1_750007 [Gammaproteobacteria bacterium]